MSYEELKQKCVDGEISNVERRRLLEWLDDNPAQWKELACSYMEDQLFGQAIVAEPLLTRAKADVPRPRPVAERWRHWFAHPVTSVALCLCVAFLSGMLLRDNSGGAVATQDGSVPYHLTSTTNSEIPRAMSGVLKGLGYNQTEPSKRSRPTSSTYTAPNGRRYLKLTPQDGPGMMMPIDQIQVILP